MAVLVRNLWINKRDDINTQYVFDILDSFVIKKGWPKSLLPIAMGGVIVIESYCLLATGPHTLAIIIYQ